MPHPRLRIYASTSTVPRSALEAGTSHCLAVHQSCCTTPRSRIVAKIVCSRGGAIRARYSVHAPTADSAHALIVAAVLIEHRLVDACAMTTAGHRAHLYSANAAGACNYSCLYCDAIVFRDSLFACLSAHAILHSMPHGVAGRPRAASKLSGLSVRYLKWTP